MFKKHYCIVCGKLIKWYEKVIVEEKANSLTDHVGNITLYKHEEITHSKCASDKLKEAVKQQKKSKKRKDDDDDDTTNLDQIRAED